jgi:hopanoid biosynthesis associated RND transporter like protein HpnN
MLGSKALLFVPDADLIELRKMLGDYRPFIEKFGQTTNLASLFALINAQFRTAKAEANAENEAMAKSIPALERIVRLATESLKRTGVPPSPGVTALFDPEGRSQEQIYITFAEGRIFLITMQAPNEAMNHPAVERLRQLVEETRLEVPGVNIGLTGEPVLELDEMAQSQSDTLVASVASLIVCALIFIYGYQETGRPIKATACLLIGIGYTMGFTSLVVGHLNILTITFVPILIGLAIDYGVHLISRYEEGLRHGLTEREALRKAMVYTGQGILSGGFTTATAFLAMAFTDFRGIQEMGIICGGGLLVCLVPMLTLLPVWLLKGRQNVIDHALGDKLDARARLENMWLTRPVAVTVLTLACCAFAGWQARKVGFDYNLLNMQSKGLPAVQFERKLIASATKSVLHGAVVATNLDQALRLEQQLTNLPAVAGIESISRFLTEDQTNKLEIVRQLKHDLANLHFPEPDHAPVDLSALSRTLFSLSGYLGNAIEFVGADDPELVKALRSLREAVRELRKAMLRGGPAEHALAGKTLGQYQHALFGDLERTFTAMRSQDTAEPLRIADLPEALRDRFVGVTGKHLIMVYPRGDIWQREVQEQFIKEVVPVFPDVTGTPVQLYHYTELLKSRYVEAARYSLIAIILLVLVHFRSVLCVLLALVPVVVGALWMVGLMGLAGIDFNPANIMTLPLVIGIGVTNGIHILNRFAEEQNPSILARSTGKAVLVSGLTSIAGFGSLMLAEHQGIYSLGYVMSVGLATCMISGLTFLPALLNLLLRWRPKEQPSADNARSTLGREEPRLNPQDNDDDIERS